MPIHLRCLDAAHFGQIWTVDSDGVTATISDSLGRVTRFPPRDIVASFQMPSFSRSIKHFGIVGQNGVLQFDVSRQDLSRLKAILERALVACGPETVKVAKKTALRDTLIGLAMSAAGVILTVWSYQSAEDEYYLFYGLVIVGLAVLARGISGIARYHRLAKLCAASAGRA